MKNNMENTCSSNFNTKLNEDAYKVCTTPNIRYLEN